MKYATATAFRHALEARLLERSRHTGLGLLRLRRTVVFERLLARLLATASDRWVLKGGFALDCRLGTRARTTKDMDLGRYDDETAAVVDIHAAQSTDLGDFFVFQIERTSQLDAALEGAAVRYRVRAELAGRPFETVTLDIGFSPSHMLAHEDLLASDLLSFAGIDPITVPVLPLAQHVAEKVHAYTRTYGATTVSTRVKDLVDLVLISSTESIEAGALRQALANTFSQRGTHGLPVALPPPPTSWTAPYARMASELDINADMTTARRMSAGFLDPILADAVSKEAWWDPGERSWIKTCESPK